jgi:lysozyme
MIVFDIFNMASIQDAIKQVLLEQDLPPPTEIHHTQQHQFDSSFIEYVKNAENGIRKGYNKKMKRWYPYRDTKHRFAIAYGHNIMRGENFTKGITEEQALSMLHHDIEVARLRARNEIDNAYYPGAFDSLSVNAQEMLTDFTYNLGTLESFPKFVRAVLTDDFPTVLREYKRYANGKELTDRNKRFYERYLANRLTVR